MEGNGREGKGDTVVEGNGREGKGDTVVGGQWQGGQGRHSRGRARAHLLEKASKGDTRGNDVVAVKEPSVNTEAGPGSMMYSVALVQVANRKADWDLHTGE